MSLQKQFKKISRINKNTKIVVAVIVVMLAINMGGYLQTGYTYDWGVETIWDIGSEIKGITYEGTYIAFDNIDNARSVSATQIKIDPDGDVVSGIAGKTMDLEGLLPQYDIAINGLFHVDVNGDSTADRAPKASRDVNGIRYLTYYFGFSISLATVSNPGLLSFSQGFTYYGDWISTSEIPEFAAGSIGVDVGIYRTNIDITTPTEVEIKNIKSVNSTMRIMGAASLGESENIDIFNEDYNWIDDRHHEASIVVTTDQASLVPSGKYDASYKLISTLDPASEYVIPGEWNVFDIELLNHYMIEIELNYELLADAGDYLAGKLHVIGANIPPPPPPAFDFWAYIFGFLNWLVESLAAWLGLDVFTLTIILIIVGIVSLYLIIKILKRTGRVYTRVYGL